MTEVYVIAQVVDYEGETLLGVALSLEQAQKLVADYAQSHGLKLGAWETKDNAWVADAWFSAADDWNGDVSSADALQIVRIEVGSPLKLWWRD